MFLNAKFKLRKKKHKKKYNQINWKHIDHHTNKYKERKSDRQIKVNLQNYCAKLNS